MQRILIALQLLSLLLLNSKLQAQDFQTVTYYQDDTTNLALDLFLPQNQSESSVPLVIYVHGGGFSGGNRSGGHNLARFLAPKGYAVASITYTLYMKGKNFSCGGVLSEKVKAIQIAVNHLWLATGFMLKNAEKYKIDEKQIFIAGSSAGAETVFHAAFWNKEIMNIYPSFSLPSNFSYAGLISGAGAIMDLNLITKANQIPIMMFHGNADPLVPYGTAAHHFCPTNASGWLMLFGSYAVYEHLKTLDGDAFLITYCGGKHNYAGKHFYQEQSPVYDFLEKVRNKQHFQIHDIKPSDTINASPSQYSFCR